MGGELSLDLFVQQSRAKVKRTKYAYTKLSEQQRELHIIPIATGGIEDINNYNANGAKISTIGDNPTKKNKSYAEGINIHHAGKKGFTAAYTDKNGNKGGISEGCQIIYSPQWAEMDAILFPEDQGDKKSSLKLTNNIIYNTWIVR